MEYNVCHVEIPILDKEKAKDFYKNVFKWDIDFNQLKNYGLLNNSEVTVGFPIKDNIGENSASVFIRVTDINKQLAIASQYGAKIIHEKTELSNKSGFTGYFSDIFGNRIGLYSQK